MDSEELRLLSSPAVRQAIDEACERDPLEVALDAHVPHARLVATQVKYRQRARHKLPSFAAVGCIFPPRAFEQASSEVCACCKRIEGETVLDLTCGLGVDAWALSRRFRRVTTLERDPVLAAVAAENFSRLGITNIEVVNSAAEDFLQRDGLSFDWIYADPDRRSADG
ncbi:MAG: RsmD family RNA methyltransferase, partial [Alistipes sp.]|nr:RsmD family RNA methyltransferase [Alistipes sp.]